jgi:hypothetical protein
LRRAPGTASAVPHRSLFIEIADDGDLAAGGSDQVALIADDLVQGDLAQMFDAFLQREAW